MAFKKCKSCQSKLRTKAKCCPKCGGVLKYRTSRCLVCLFFVLLLALVVFGALSYDPNYSATATKGEVHRSATTRRKSISKENEDAPVAGSPRRAIDEIKARTKDLPIPLTECRICGKPATRSVAYALCKVNLFRRVRVKMLAYENSLKSLCFGCGDRLATRSVLYGSGDGFPVYFCSQCTPPKRVYGVTSPRLFFIELEMLQFCWGCEPPNIF